MKFACSFCGDKFKTYRLRLRHANRCNEKLLRRAEWEARNKRKSFRKHGRPYQKPAPVRGLQTANQPAQRRHMDSAPLPRQKNGMVRGDGKVRSVQGFRERQNGG